MKKLIAFLSAIVLLASCQKKEYASFQKSSTPNYVTAKKRVVAAQPIIEKNTSIVASTETKIDNDLIASNFGDESLKSGNNGILSEKEINGVLSQTSEIKTSEIKITNKKFSKKLGVVKEKSIKKLNKNVSKSNKVNSVDGKSILSLILGILGFIFMGGGGGILFGIPSIILGIIALKKGTPNRTMAILGLVFGGISLLGLLLL